MEALLSYGALTGFEQQNVHAAKIKFERCGKLLEVVLGKPDDIACCRLLEALDKTEQSHVVKFILQDEGTSRPR